MKKIRHLFAKGIATQFVLASFTRPALLEKETFSHYMNRLFSRLAPSYDRIGERLASESMTLGPLCAALQSLRDAPEKILDLACGTGLATLKVRALFPDAKICGADISEKMVRELIRKTKERESENVSALICNSARLPFKEDGFDLVMTQNAPPYPEEMVRVLGPGGRLVLAYSFVFDSLVRGVIRKRLAALELEEITFFQAQEGIAVMVRKPERSG